MRKVTEKPETWDSFSLTPRLNPQPPQINAIKPPCSYFLSISQGLAFHCSLGSGPILSHLNHHDSHLASLLVTPPPRIHFPSAAVKIHTHTHTHCIYCFLQQWFSNLNVHQIQLEAY